MNVLVYVYYMKLIKDSEFVENCYQIAISNHKTKRK